MAQPVSLNHAKIVCKLGEGKETCSFLTLGAGQFECVKGTIYQAHIAERRAKRNMSAMGDNCSGPPNYTPTP